MNRSLPHGVGVVRGRYTYLAAALLLCVTAFHVSPPVPRKHVIAIMPTRLCSMSRV